MRSLWIRAVMGDFLRPSLRSRQLGGPWGRSLGREPRRPASVRLVEQLRSCDRWRL